MKKSTLFLACCIGLMLLASCKKEITPTITPATGPEYVSQNATVFSGDPITVGFYATGENLVSIMLTAEQNGISLFSHADMLDNVPSYSYTKTFTIDATGAVTIRGTVTDAKGNTVSTSFDVNFNVKPNAKFVGHYEGNLLVSGDVDINVSNMDPMHEVLDNEPCPAVLDIEAGEGINDVKAVVSINNQQNVVNGTVDGNKVVFEAIDDTFTFHYSYQGIDIPIPLNMTYTINGMLNGDELNLDGTCNGNGSVNLFIYSGSIELEGTIGGIMNKTR